jgi:lysophospholipase L1-like esterase
MVKENKPVIIHESIEFHNVSNLESVPNQPGLALARFPKQIRDSLGHPSQFDGRYVASASTGCEIRFVTESNAFLLSMSARDCSGTIVIFNGDIFHSIQNLESGKITTFKITRPERFSLVKDEMTKSPRFSSNVWRILVGRSYDQTGNYMAIFHGIDSLGFPVRPPNTEEKPRFRWLAYGSSITHGSGATQHHLSYVQLAALYSGVDVLNKGIGGNCLAEPALIDFFIRNHEWDMATFEIGVNMRNNFTPDQFEERLRFLLDSLTISENKRPVLLISILPNWSSKRWVSRASEITRKEDRFNCILGRLYKEYKRQNLAIVEGKTLLVSPHYLTSDLIHPSDYGHSQIAKNLTAFFIRNSLVPKTIQNHHK